MKTKIFLSAMLAIAFLISSCDPNAEDNKDKNYWEQNALVRMQLKGKVKTVTENSFGTEVTQFNENGFVTSITQSGQGSLNVSTYTYLATGELNKIVSVNTATTTTTSTTTYEYEPHGKYVALFPMHLYEMGLVPNLKAIVNADHRADYKFIGDDLHIINTWTTQNMKDTSIIKYNGKYPVSSSSDMHFIKDISFASNGMFKTCTEGFGDEGYSDSRIYTFKTDAEYQLKESVNYVNKMGTNTRTETEAFTYNDKKDLIKTVRAITNVTDIVYEYDAQNNWTKKTSTSTYEGSTTPNIEIVTRTIQYWTDNKTTK